MAAHVFEHAEFDGARKSRFQAHLGVVNLIRNFWKCMGSKIKKAKIVSHGGLSYAKWWEDSKSGLKIQIG